MISLLYLWHTSHSLRIRKSTPTRPGRGPGEPVANVEFNHFTPKFVNNTMGHRKANAAFVILVRNNELKIIVESIHQIEDRFNRQYGYDYVFLNEAPFTDEFVKCVSPPLQTATLMQELIKLDLDNYFD
jgi:hypothetical protein